MIVIDNSIFFGDILRMSPNGANSGIQRFLYDGFQDGF